MREFKYFVHANKKYLEGMRTNSTHVQEWRFKSLKALIRGSHNLAAYEYKCYYNEIIIVFQWIAVYILPILSKSRFFFPSLMQHIWADATIQI